MKYDKSMAAYVREVNRSSDDKVKAALECFLHLIELEQDAGRSLVRQQRCVDLWILVTDAIEAHKERKEK